MCWWVFLVSAGAECSQTLRAFFCRVSNSMKWMGGGTAYLPSSSCFCVFFFFCLLFSLLGFSIQPPVLLPLERFMVNSYLCIAHPWILFFLSFTKWAYQWSRYSLGHSCFLKLLLSARDPGRLWGFTAWVPFSRWFSRVPRWPAVRQDSFFPSSSGTERLRVLQEQRPHFPVSFAAVCRHVTLIWQ